MSESMQNLPDEELAALLDRYRTDFPFCATRLYKVLAIDNKIVPFEFNGPQLILHRIISEIEPRRLVRLILLKMRRAGSSTYFSGRGYHKASWNFNHLAMQITHEPAATETLFGMVKRIYDHTPEWLRPTTRYNNAQLLDFNTKDGKGLGSGFRVATAAKDDVGSGQLVHFLHLSEVAKWPAENAKSLLTAVLQCVPREPGTEVIFESTGKGIGGEFYDRFWGARYRYFIKKLDPVITAQARKEQRLLTKEEIAQAACVVEEINESTARENQTTAIFLPWFCFEKYQMTPPPDFVPQPNDDKRLCEVTMQQRFNLTNAQLYWWRFVFNNDEIRGDINTMQQEYPATPEEAFIATGRPVFDSAKVMALRDAAPKPIARYDLTPIINQFVAHPEGRLLVWEEAKAGESYLIAADVAEGLEHGDSSVADVIHHRTGQQVAQWQGKLDPDLFAHLLAALGKRYNTALLAPERNNHGLTVVKWLHEIIQYPNLYVEMVPDPPGKPRKRYGWQTSSATRPLIIDVLVKEIRDDCHGIQCAATLEEMLAFKVQANGRMEADNGRHDDRVMALAIGKYLRTVLPLPEPQRPEHIKSAAERRNRRVPTLGWT